MEWSESAVTLQRGVGSHVAFDRRAQDIGMMFPEFTGNHPRKPLQGELKLVPFYSVPEKQIRGTIFPWKRLSSRLPCCRVQSSLAPVSTLLEEAGTRSASCQSPGVPFPEGASPWAGFLSYQCSDVSPPGAQVGAWVRADSLSCQCSGVSPPEAQVGARVRVRAESPSYQRAVLSPPGV